MLKYNFFNKNLNIILLSFLFISIIANKYNTVFDFGYSLRFHDLIFLILFLKFFFETKLTKLIIPQNMFFTIILLFIIYFFLRFIIENNYTNIRYILTLAVFFLFNSKLITKYDIFKNTIFIYLILLLNLYIFVNFIIESYEYSKFKISYSYFFVRGFDGVSTINQMSLFSCFSLILLFFNKNIKFKGVWYLIAIFNLLIFRSYVVIIFILVILGLYIFQKIKLNFKNLFILLLIAFSIIGLRFYSHLEQDLLNLKSQSSLEIRSHIIDRDYEILKNKLQKSSLNQILFGGGAGYIYKLTSEYNILTENLLNEKFSEQMPWYAKHVINDTTHNIIYQLFFEHGLIGLFVYFYLLFLFIKIFFWFKNYQKESSLIFMLTFTHLHFHMFNPGEIEIFLLIFSIMLYNFKTDYNISNAYFTGNKK